MSITTTTTIYNRRDGTSQTLAADQAALKTYYQRETWSAQPLPPRDWEKTVPRYRIVRDLKPAEKNRFRFENPFSETSSNDTFQYGEHPLKAGQIVEIKTWPHPSMCPLNYSAERVLSFFIGTIKSRLQQSPWCAGRIRLESGIGGAPMLTEVRGPKPQPFNTRPAA